MKKSYFDYAFVMFIALLIGMTFSATSTQAADPSLKEVYQAADAGNLPQAEAMMGQVLRDHPNSAKAHFVEAELLAKERRLDMSRAELATAERLAPGLPFAKSGTVAALKEQLNTPVRVSPATTPISETKPAQDFPWGLLLVGVAVFGAVIFFVRSMNRPRFSPAGGPNYIPAGATGNNLGSNPQPYGAGGMGPMGQTGGGMGSGILGGLATGAAVGAGMVAGEALMHRVFNGGSSETARLQPQNDTLSSPASNFDMGGNDFGVSDNGSWDDGCMGGGGSDDWG